MDQITPSMTYGLTALTLAILAIPLLTFAWQVIKAPIRIWVPLLAFLAAILLLHGISDLTGPDGMIALIYILGGFRG